MCKKGQARIMAEGEYISRENAIKTKLTIYGQEIEKATEFTYLGRVLTDNDQGTFCIQRQIKKSREIWGWIAIILKTENAISKTMGRFYTRVLQSVLLYGSESWVIGKSSWKILNSFHMRCTRHMVGRHIIHLSDDTWECPLLPEF